MPADPARAPDSILQGRIHGVIVRARSSRFITEGHDELVLLDGMRAVAEAWSAEREVAARDEVRRLTIEELREEAIQRETAAFQLGVASMRDRAVNLAIQRYAYNLAEELRAAAVAALPGPTPEKGGPSEQP